MIVLMIAVCNVAAVGPPPRFPPIMLPMQDSNIQDDYIHECWRDIQCIDKCHETLKGELLKILFYFDVKNMTNFSSVCALQVCMQLKVFKIRQFIILSIVIRRRRDETSVLPIFCICQCVAPTVCVFATINLFLQLYLLNENCH